DDTIKRIGTNVPPETQLSILESLEFGISETTDSGASVSSPPRRHDATRPADLVEEILRHYGFHNIEPTLPNIRPTETVYAPNYKRLQHLRTQLTNIGLTEIYTWTFTSREDLQNTLLTEALDTAIPLENPLSEKNELMRPTLIPSVLHVASRNIRKNAKNIRIFELAPVYFQTQDADSSTQQDRLTICISGDRTANHWSATADPSDAYDLKGYVEEVAALLGDTEIVLKSADQPTYAVGECASIHAKGNHIGYMGRIHKSVADKFDIDQDIYIAEIQVRSLLKKKRSHAKFKQVTEHPASLRDIAVVVDESIPAGEIRSSAAKAGGKLLQNVEIFDIFTGEQVGEGKKSIALNLTFQSHERTLTDKDTDKAWKKIVKTLQHNFNAELR
ncbi:MAG: phenylalanine--tRNA ligase subunit beta, partial [Candidatus Hydrogenedentota bacterium]